MIVARRSPVCGGTAFTLNGRSSPGAIAVSGSSGMAQPQLLWTSKMRTGSPPIFSSSKVACAASSSNVRNCLSFGLLHINNSCLVTILPGVRSGVKRGTRNPVPMMRSPAVIARKWNLGIMRFLFERSQPIKSLSCKWRTIVAGSVSTDMPVIRIATIITPLSMLR